VLHNRALDIWHSLSLHFDRMNLFETLNTLGHRIKLWYPEINEGGCCVYASIIGEELLARGIETRIVVAGSDGSKTNLNRIRRKVGNTKQKSAWHDVGIYFTHVGVEFKLGGKWFIYDCDGVNPRGLMLGLFRTPMKLGNFKLHPGFISVADATALAAEPEGWNYCFDRKSIPSMKKRVKKFLMNSLPEKVVDQIPC
jgi:hypothetical protein